MRHGSREYHAFFTFGLCGSLTAAKNKIDAALLGATDKLLGMLGIIRRDKYEFTLSPPAVNACRQLFTPCKGERTSALKRRNIP